MDQVNSFDQETNVSGDMVRLLKDWLAQKKENEPKKLFDEAWRFVEQRPLEPEERMNFLQNVWLCLFRENLCDARDDDRSDGTRASNDYGAIFAELYADKDRTYALEDKNNLKREMERRLDIERRKQFDRRNFVELPLQIIPKDDERKLPSLGNLCETNVLIQTGFDISSQITNACLTDKAPTTKVKRSRTYETTSFDVRSHSSGQKDVFIGKQPETRQNVAVKASRNAQSDNATIREAIIQASIAHQGVPTIISLNQEGVPIIVEPFINGKSWAENFDSQAPNEDDSPSLEENIKVLLQVGDIMSYVHRESGIVHGDLKPDNVMIGKYGEVYVIDWGFAVRLDDDENERRVQGYTKQYVPPEIWTPKGYYGTPQPATAAADVYMLGGILYQIVVPSHKTFNEVREEFSPYEVSNWLRRGVFPDFPDDVPKGMREILKKALQPEPENRYQDAGEFVDALRKYLKLRRFNENVEQFTLWKNRAEEESRLESDERTGASDALSAIDESRDAEKDRRLETALITSRLSACVDEFESIRKVMEGEFDIRKKIEDEDVERQRKALKKALQDETFVDVLRNELQARSYLLERLIELQARSSLWESWFGVKDYDQTSALVETQADVVSQYLQDDVTPDFFGQIETERQSQKARIDNGNRRRKRNRIAAIAGFVFVVFMVVVASLTSLVLQARAETAIANEKTAIAHKETAIAIAQKATTEKTELEKRNKLEAEARKTTSQQFLEYYKHASTAREEKFGQGEVAFWAKALELIEQTSKSSFFPRCYNWLDAASKTSILPQQSSSFNSVVKSSGFSTDGRFFMFQDVRDNFDVWDAETLQTVSSFKLSFPKETTTYIEANPCFKDEERDESIFAFRFLLFNTDGDVWLASNLKQETKAASFLANVRKAADNARNFGLFDSNSLVMKEDEFKKNLDVDFDKLNFTSCYVTEQDAEGRALFFVGAETGETLTFSLPDFKLVGIFKTSNEIYQLAASVQKKYVVIVDKKDWTCRRYALDGTLLNEYDFDFTPEDSYDGERWLRIAPDPSGKKLVAGNELGTICVLDVDSNKLLAKTRNVQDEGKSGKGIAGLYWLDEERFLSLGHNNDCRVWNLNKTGTTGIPRSLSIDCGLSEDCPGVRTATFSPRTQKLALAGVDPKLRFVDVCNRRLIAQTTGITASASGSLGVSDVAYLPEKNVLILGSLSTPFDSIKAIDADSFKEIRGFNPAPKAPFTKDWDKTIGIASSIATPSVGSEFAVALTSGKIVFFDADDSNPVGACDELQSEQVGLENKNIPVIAADSNARFLVGKTTLGNEIILWDWENKEEIRRWNVLNGTRSEKYQIEKTIDLNSESDGDDSEIVSSNSNDADGSTLPFTIGLCFIDDENFLEVLGDGGLKLWNSSSGKLTCENEVEDDERKTWCFALSRDKKRIALGRDDGSVLIVSTKKLTTLACLKSTQAELSNQNSTVYDVKNEDRERERDVTPTSATGVSWSQNDELLCVAYANGNAAVFDVPKEHGVSDDAKDFPLRAAFAVNRKYDATSSRFNPLYVSVFFTQNDRLITLDTNGLIQYWDYAPSSESATSLYDRAVVKLCVGDSQRQEFALINSSSEMKIYSGSDVKYESNDIKDVQYWKKPYGASRFLALHLTGKFISIDGNESCIIDEHSGFPTNGLEAFCVSSDGTKIAGTEKGACETWTLDLTQSDSKWERTPWRNKQERACKLAFSPNSQFLVSVDDHTLRLWDFKTRQELFKVGASLPAQDKNDVGNIGSPCFISENLVVQTGSGNVFYIWDVKARSMFQKVQVQLNGDVYGIRTCENLNKGAGKTRPTTFVVIGADDVLRFYQLSKETNQFEPIYVLSRMRLNKETKEITDKDDLYADEFSLKGNQTWIDEQTQDESEYASTSRPRTIVQETLQDRPRTTVHEYLTIGQEALQDLSASSGDEPTIGTGNPESTFNGALSKICDVSLSDDGKKLYVGSCEGLCAYDMEEIWRNIDNLPETWSNADVERLTGLRFNSFSELTPFTPDRMVPVDK